MAKPAHVDLLRAGSDSIRAWRREHPRARLDLSGADLQNIHLIQVQLGNADFSDADLALARLWRVDLRGANFGAATLHSVDFSSSDLSDVQFSSADLAGAHFSNCTLRDTDFGFAGFVWTVFELCDLSHVRDLTNVMHFGPSHLDRHTLASLKPVAKRCRKFLEGCGYEPWEILCATLGDPTLTATQVDELLGHVRELRLPPDGETKRHLISYAHADSSELALKLYRRIQKMGAPCWLDKHDLLSGDTDKQIQQALRRADIVVLILSKASLGSTWVNREIVLAREKEKRIGRDVLCPVGLDDSWKRPPPTSVIRRDLLQYLTSKYTILDFSNWETRAFGRTFKSLWAGIQTMYGSEPNQS